MRARREDRRGEETYERADEEVARAACLGRVQRGLERNPELEDERERGHRDAGARQPGRKRAGKGKRSTHSTVFHLGAFGVRYDTAHIGDVATDEHSRDGNVGMRWECCIRTRGQHAVAVRYDSTLVCCNSVGGRVEGHDGFAGVE